MRPSSRGTQKTKTQRPRPRTSGRGKWMVLANVARFLSVSVTDLAVKVSIFNSHYCKGIAYVFHHSFHG
jgi:hypothetical protein